MKFCTVSFPLTVLTWALLLLAPFATACTTRPTTPRRAFAHPGLLHTTKDFERIKDFLGANRQPWKTGWDKLATRASADHTPRPVETVCRGAGTECASENYALLFRDAAAAYTNAVHWKITGNESHAEAAGRILDAWSSTLVRVWGSSDKFLASGIYGYQLANAGELLRDWSGWKGFPALVNMLKNIFYPMNHDFLVNHNGAVIDHYWANWDLANMCAMQAIGVLSDNATMYEEAVNYFKNGAGNGQIENAIWKLHKEPGSDKNLGQGQEAGRDQGHALLDFAFLGVFAQQSYSQGDDLFGYLDNRILAGAEYVAKYNLGHDVPFETFTNSHGTAEVISEVARGQLRPIWELLYSHYDSIKGLNASWTGQMRDHVNEEAGGAEGGGGDYGPNSGGYDQLGFGTLLYRIE
ncbi:exopolysaccharide inner membrane protein [Colletotrichum truncatum]|uniref:Exopolysaccharide inner membrane protein n=1 Tax=Colletotrichum truncatum TaxID=5467 RepID=A0ACC3ZGS6_COLTU|nr:exopolysaccharide inner membrane protein [Colletotrichum truncatum]KAF6790502.1 exopolysaccharide inner membrane protein [Colletotrichum truncatum]